METQNDFKELLELFNAHKVESPTCAGSVFRFIEPGISDARRLFAVFIGRIWIVIRIYLPKAFTNAFDLPILRV